MKKAIAVSFALLVLSAAQLTAFAHGHSGYGRNAAPRTYYVCTYENCSVAVNHAHNGVNYYGHYNSDGHAQCAVAAGGAGSGGYCCGAGYY